MDLSEKEKKKKSEKINTYTGAKYTITEIMLPSIKENRNNY